MDLSKYKLSTSSPSVNLSKYKSQTEIQPQQSLSDKIWADLGSAGNVLGKIFPGKKIGEAFGTAIAKTIVSKEQKQFVSPGPSSKEYFGDVAMAGLTVLPFTKALKPATTIIGRIAQGTALGAGFGAAGAITEDKDIKEIAKSTAIGAGVGFGVSGLLEGVGAGLRVIGNREGTQKLVGNVYNKELQPPMKEISKDIQSGFKTFGEEVSNVTDNQGNPIYTGTYKTLLAKAKNEVVVKGSELNKTIRSYDNLTATRYEVAGELQQAMENIYGKLKSSQIKAIEFEASRMPEKMNMSELLKAKRMYDDLIPDSFWSKLDDPAVSFPSYVKYLLRDSARTVINEKTGDPLIQKLNNEMSIGMEVKKLVSNQLAKRALSKISEIGGTGQARNPFSYVISKFIDDVLLNPTITTRVSQAIKTAGQQTGQTVLRQIGRLGTIFGIQKGIRK